MKNYIILSFILLPHIVLGSEIFNIEKCNQLYQNRKTEELEEYLAHYQMQVNEQEAVNYKICYAKHLRSINDIDNAINVLHQAIAVEKIYRTQIQLAHIYDELAICLRSGGTGDLNSALNYINKSIEIKQQSKSLDEIARSNLIKGNVLYTLFKNEKIPNKELSDSIQYYWNKSINQSTESNIINLAYNNLATLDIELKNFRTADSIYTSLLLKEEDKTRRSDIEFNRIANFMEAGNFESAGRVLDSIFITTEYDTTSISKYRISALKAAILDSLGNYKEALAWRDSVDFYHHKFADDENYKAEAKYKNAELKLILANKESEALKNRIWAGTLGTIALLLAIGLFILNNFRKLKLSQAETDLENEILESKIKATISRIEGEQHERKAIASFLHDQVSSLLTATDLHLNVLKKTLDQDSKKIVDKPISLVKKVSNQVRDISHQLVSPTLIKFGITEAIQSLVSELGSDNYSIISTLDEIPDRLEYTKEVFLLQSTSELLNNAMKHGEGNACKIKLTNLEFEIELSVTNQVIKDQGTNENSLGTLELISRAEAFGGSFKRNYIDDNVNSILVIQK